MKETEQLKKVTRQDQLVANSILIPSVAELYANVFASWPWFEVSKGPTCEKFYGPDLTPGLACPCGCGVLVPAYPMNETADYINSELSKTLAYGQIVLFKKELAGFAWGFQLSGKEFITSKYKSYESQIVIGKLI